MKRKPSPVRKFSKYELPKPRYKPGHRVKLRDFPLGLSFRVISSSHTHTQVEGLPAAIPNWQLRWHSSR
jgi:hypothetical protein